MSRSKLSIATVASLFIGVGCLVAPGVHAAEPAPPVGADIPEQPTGPEHAEPAGDRGRSHAGCADSGADHE